MEFARAIEYRTEAASLPCNPEQKNQANREHQGRTNTLQEFYGFDAAPDYEHVDAPKEKEADPQASGNLCRGGPAHLQQGVHGLAADPGLNAEPAAGDQRAEHGGNVRAADAE